MKRCKRCNKLMSDQAKYCTTCGAVCESDAAPAPAAPEKPRGSRPSAPEKPASDAAAPRSTAPRKRKPKRRVSTLALLLVAIAVAAAIVIVAVRACRKPAPVPTAALTEAQPVGGAAAPLPDAGSARIETPLLTGLTLEEARAKLAALGLVADVYEAGYDPAYMDGYVFAQDVAEGEWLVKGDHIALSVNELPLTLTVLQTSVRSGRITLGNIVEVCRTMGTNNPNFDYSIVIHAVEDYELKGGFRCLIGTGEETPVSRVNTQLLRQGALINGLDSAVAYKDAIVWTFALEDWMGFHFENVTGYDVYLTNRVDTATAVSKTFQPERTKTMALVDCPINGGRIRVDIPTADALAIRITDDQLPSGYTNSPSGTGKNVPKWEIKLVESSYKWISATVDGTGGEPQAGMAATGHKFVQKGAQATTFADVSYTVGGDVMVVSVPIPQDMDFDPYRISYLELRFGDGAYTEKIKIQ